MQKLRATGFQLKQFATDFMKQNFVCEVSLWCLIALIMHAEKLDWTSQEHRDTYEGNQRNLMIEFFDKSKNRLVFQSYTKQIRERPKKKT